MLYAVEHAVLLYCKVCACLTSLQAAEVTFSVTYADVIGVTKLHAAKLHAIVLQWQLILYVSRKIAVGCISTTGACTRELSPCK